MKSHSVKSHVRSRINEGPHPWSGFSPQMNEEWTFLQMNVKLISPKYKRSSFLSPESDGWIFHVPRDRPTGRGGCSCQVFADPRRPELAHHCHQVENLQTLLTPFSMMMIHHTHSHPDSGWPAGGGTVAQLTCRSPSSSRTSTTTPPSSKAQVYPPCSTLFKVHIHLSLMQLSLYYWCANFFSELNC